MPKKSDQNLEPKIRRSNDQNKETSASKTTEGTVEERTLTDRSKPIASVPLKGFGPNAQPLEVPKPNGSLPTSEPRPKQSSEEPSRRSSAAASDEGFGEFMTFEEGSSDDFAALLSGTGSAALPENRRYKVGDEVEGTILTIGEEYIYVDLGASYEGIAKVSEFQNEEGELPFGAGDTVSYFVTSFRDGTISLGRHIDATGPGTEALEQAYASGLPIEGRVASANKGGYVIVVGDAEGFCPISHIERTFTEDPSVHVGQSYHFKVIEMREDGRNPILSRSVLLEQEEKEARKRLLENLHEGDKLNGKVTRIAEFGAFVDLQGVEGLLHISEIGYQHIEHPSEILSEGEEIKVEIVSIDDTGDRLKIGLSRKNCLEDPWETIYKDFAPGTEVNGTVVRLESFGAFVELKPGIEGLVHVSEMSWNKRIRHASDVVSNGDTVLVRVKEVDPQRRRISLSMKSNEADPWATVNETLKLGQEVTGTVDRVEDFGAFIRLEKPEITALLPRSEMDLSRNETPYSKTTKGSSITARILDIDKGRRRMALTLKPSEELDKIQGRAQDPVDYQDGSKLGTFADLLKKHLKK